MMTMHQDARYALRMLCRNPAFTAVAVLSLALGIGASTSVFSVVDRILFRSLPYAHGDRLLSVGIGAPVLPYEFIFGAAYLDLRTHQQTFEAVTSWSGVNDCDLTDGEPVRLSCAAVESTFLSTVGIAPLLGRSFTAGEDGPSTPKVALLSYGLWQSRFGGRPDVLGRTIQLNGQPARVVGVLPPEFETPTLARADLVIPQGLDDATLERAVTGRPLRVLARVRPGTDLAAVRAAAELALLRSLPALPGGIGRELKPRVRTLRDFQAGDSRTVSWVLFGSVVAVLLLACANLANLLLARTVARQRELAVRVALGAGRMRLVRQSLTESLVLAVLGGGAGALLAGGLLMLFVNLAPEGIPRLAEATLDARVLAFTFGSALLCGLAFGIGPALSCGLPSGPGVTGGRGWARPALIVTQFALSLALLTGAGLLGRALWSFQHVPLGMETEQVLTASFSLAQQRYPDAARQLAFSEALEERLRNSPGVVAVALGDSHPPNVPLRSKPMYGLEIDGRPPDPARQGTVVWRAVTPGYFRALGIPVLRGRAFTEQDRDPGREVMMVSESLAKRLFPGGDALGRLIGKASIVGIAANVRNSGGTAADDPEYYVPRSRAANAPVYQYPDELRRACAIVRTPLATEVAARVLRDAVRGLDAALPVQIETLSQSTSRLAARPRFNAMLIGLFAAIGLALAAFGLYGVLGYVVAQRTREIGIRMALGATPAAVSRMVLGSAGRWLAAGLVCGLVLSAAMSRALHALLYGAVSGHDAAAWTSSAVVLLLAALAAAWLPSRRASRVDPMVALRHE
ncbi:MAG: ABC transporter permease [Acidobacteriia bacterium]|nr:ABC transporter permease [Terriglobia bacterium]